MVRSMLLLFSSRHIFCLTGAPGIKANRDYRDVKCIYLDVIKRLYYGRGVPLGYIGTGLGILAHRPIWLPKCQYALVILNVRHIVSPLSLYLVHPI